jgi:hypothetical protein
MSYPDLSDLRYRVRNQLSEASSVNMPDAMINRWINDGEFDVSVKSLGYEREHSLITTASVRYVQATFVKVLGVEYIPSTGGRRGLGKINPRMVGHLTLTGTTPQFWFPWGDRVCIEPIPQEAYNLLAYVSIVPTQLMSADTDEPEVPEFLIPWIIEYATIHGLLRNKKYASVSLRYGVYAQNIAMIRNTILAKYADTRPDFEIPDLIEATRNGA